MAGAINQFQSKLATSARPGVIGRPYINVLIGRSVKIKAAGRCVHSVSYVIEAGSRACDLLRNWITGCYDTQAKVAAQAEFDRHGPTGVDNV